MPHEVLEALFMNGLGVFVLFCFVLCSLPGPKFANYVSWRNKLYLALESDSQRGCVFSLQHPGEETEEGSPFPTALLRRASSKIHVASAVFLTSPIRPLLFSSLVSIIFQSLIVLKTWHIPQFTASKFRKYFAQL